MKKIERDILLLYTITTLLNKEGFDKKEYISGYDGTLISKWMEKYFPEDDLEKPINLLKEIANNVYEDIKNKK